MEFRLATKNLVFKQENGFMIMILTRDNLQKLNCNNKKNQITVPRGFCIRPQGLLFCRTETYRLL